MKLFLKGLIIGIGKILPGISGSVLAISLNEYKNIINSLNNLHNKKSLIYLIKIGLGILIAIIVLSKFLYLLLNKNPFLMLTLFVGLILGTIPNMVKTINKSNIIYIIIGFIFLSSIEFIKINTNLTEGIKGIVIGIVESISTLIPGISGTAILTNLNLYNDYLLKWSGIYKIKFIISNYSFFILFFISLIVTSIILIKLIDKALIKYENKMNGIIFGFILSSLYLLFKKIPYQVISIKNIFLFFLMLAIGFIIGYKLNLVNDN